MQTLIAIYLAQWKMRQKLLINAVSYSVYFYVDQVIVNGTP